MGPFSAIDNVAYEEMTYKWLLLREHALIRHFEGSTLNALTDSIYSQRLISLTVVHVKSRLSKIVQQPMPRARVDQRSASPLQIQISGCSQSTEVRSSKVMLGKLSQALFAYPESDHAKALVFAQRRLFAQLRALFRS
ncbi:hypothetical protein D3C87_1244090 [compost metagenome]